jgi:hypothetical protein
MADLRSGLHGFQVRHAALQEVASRRGYEVLGDRMLPGGRGGSGYGGALATAGRFVDTAMAGAAASASVAMVAAAWQFARRSAEAYGDTQQQVFQAGMRLGGGFAGIRASGAAGLQGPLRLSYAESIGGTMALAMQTGRTDSRGIAALARAYGLPVEATAQLVGQMGSLGIMPPERTTRRTVTETSANPAYASAAALRERWMSGAANRRSASDELSETIDKMRCQAL